MLSFQYKLVLYMAVSSTCPRLVFRHCVNCVLYKVYPTTVSPYSSSTMLYHRANLWRNACMYVITTLVMLQQNTKLVTPHMKLHSILQTVSCCQYMQCSWQPDHKKHNIRYFPITTIKTSYSRIITVIQNCLNTNSTK